MLSLQRTAGNRAVAQWIAAELRAQRAAFVARADTPASTRSRPEPVEAVSAWPVGPGAAGARVVQRAAASTAATANPEQTLVGTMIGQGKKDENGLTNAVFYSRHPDLSGKPLPKGSPLAKEWLAIRDTLVRPTLAAPERPPTVPPLPAAAGSTTSEGPGLLERGTALVSELAHAAYEAVEGWFSGDAEATPATPQPPAKAPATGTAKPPAPGAGTAGSGEGRFHTNTPTIQGSTLDIVKTRADLGDAGTTYSLEGDGLAASLMSGDKDATTFYCSGLVIWTLAAAGYDVSKAIVGEDGKPFTWTKVTTKKDKTGKDVEKESEVKVTLKQLIDGEPAAVEAMTIAEQKGMKNGGSVGRLSGEGHALGHTATGDATAVKGAAGAFELAHLGSEIPELEQKPGDFAQSRRTTAGKGSDTEVEHRGAGHAWQVWHVRANGAALFGQKGSPKPASGELTGWHEGVEFVIDKDTLPSLVGAHTVLKASRIEANTAGAGTLDPKGEGGVQITGEADVPDKGRKSYTGYVVYYGRLDTSPWHGWTPATKPQ